MWSSGWLVATAHSHCPASLESITHCISSLGKDQNSKSKFKVWFLLNEYDFYNIAKLKNHKLNHCKSETVCTLLFVGTLSCFLSMSQLTINFTGVLRFRWDITSFRELPLISTSLSCFLSPATDWIPCFLSSDFHGSIMIYRCVWESCRHEVFIILISDTFNL